MFGRNLAGGSARLVSPTGNVSLTLVRSLSSENTATFQLPPSVRPESATVWGVAVRNSFPGSPFVLAPDTIVVSADPFNYSRVFEVKQHGLHGALRAAAEAGGGVVLFGSGRFQMTGPINLPHMTILKGAGIDRTSLWWDDRIDTSADHLIGTNLTYPEGTFAVEDLSISSKAVIASVIVNARYMDVRVRRVRIRQDAFYRVGEACPGASMRGRKIDFTAADVGAAFSVISANRFEISDCDIWATSNFAYIYDSRNIMMVRNRVRYGEFGLRLGHSVRALIEDNDIGGNSWVAGGAIFLSMYEYAGGGQTGVNSFITIRGNTIHENFGRDREAITSDGGFTSYLGTVNAVDDSGLQLTLTADPVYVLDPNSGMEMVHEDCVGIAVYVMHGPGMGQWRRVTANVGRHWAIEAPFDVPLVAGLSVLNIASLRAFHVWEENTIADAGAIQVFGSLVDSVIARNRIVRSQGFSVVGTAFPWSDGPVNATTGVYGEGQSCVPAKPGTSANCAWWQVAPAWQLEITSNHIEPGMGYADMVFNALGVVGNQDYGPWPMPNLTGPLDRAYVPFGSVSRAIVVRNNTIDNEGQISVQADRDDGVSLVDAVVEGNSVTGRSNPPDNDGPTLLLSENTSGWTVRMNVVLAPQE